MSIATPFSASGEIVVRPDWIDYNGHMNVGYYHVAFDLAAEEFFQALGFTPEFREREQGTTFALESHLNFLREVKEGDALRFEARLLDHDAKRMHYYQEMFHARQGYLAASCESLSCYVSQLTRRTAPIPETLIEGLTRVKRAHATLPRPWQVGHVISVKPLR